MILYANGCSHTAAAEAVVPYCFAVDDGRAGIDRRPHPTNLAASWCTHLSRDLDSTLVCDAESASSNDRILRTTRHWIDTNSNLLPDTLMVIQWTTWEREEWWYKNQYYQVNASGTDYVPAELRDRYRDYVVNHDYWAKTLYWYEQIWAFHLELEQLKVKHLFYNAWSTFSDIPNKRDFGKAYLGPHDRDLSYTSVLINNGFEWASPNSYHFRADGHCFWAKYLLQYIKQHNLVTTHAIPTD